MYPQNMRRMSCGDLNKELQTVKATDGFQGVGWFTNTGLKLDSVKPYQLKSTMGDGGG